MMYKIYVKGVDQAIRLLYDRKQYVDHDANDERQFTSIVMPNKRSTKRDQ